MTAGKALPARVNQTHLDRSRNWPSALYTLRAYVLEHEHEHLPMYQKPVVRVLLVNCRCDKGAALRASAALGDACCQLQLDDGVSALVALLQAAEM